MSNNELEELSLMFTDLTKSAIQDVFNANKQDFEKTVDELLTMNMSRSTLLTSVIDRSVLSEQEEFFLAERERRNKQAEQEKLELEKEQLEREYERIRLEREAQEQEKLRKLKIEADRMQREKAELVKRQLELQKLKQDQIEAERKKLEIEFNRKEKERIEVEYQREIEARRLAELEAQEKLKLLELEKLRIEQLSKEKSESEKIAQEKLRLETEEKARTIAEIKQRNEEAERLLKKTQQEFEAQAQLKEALLQKEREEKETIAAQRKAEIEKNQKLEEIVLKFEQEKQSEAEKLKKEEEEKQALLNEQSEKKKRTIIIYTRGAQDAKNDQELLTNEIKNLLEEKGISEDEYTIMDTSENQELAAYLKESCGNKEISFPIVDILRIPVGNIDQLKKILSDPSNLERIRNGEFAYEGTGQFVGQGVLDHCLDAAEYVISGVKSVLWSPVSFVGWLTGYGKSSLTKGTDDHDFEIVHTNWYWRNLKRKFRFTNDSVLRIHPVHNDVRATHTYSSIRQLQIVDDTNLVIDYNDSSPDYVQADSVDIAKMVNIIKERSATPPFVVDLRHA